jgi:hypothetical protein
VAAAPNTRSPNNAAGNIDSSNSGGMELCIERLLVDEFSRHSDAED